MGWLSQLARAPGDSLADERVRAWAIYVLTRNGVVTSGFVQSLEKHLEADYAKAWKDDLAAAYLASTYQLLKQERRGRSLIEGAKIGRPRSVDYDYYDDSLAHDAQLLYLLARHFPERAARLTPEEIDAMVQPIFRGTYNTFSSAQAILALETYGQAASHDAGGPQTVRELDAGQKRALTLPTSLLPMVSFSEKATALELQAGGPFGSYWVVAQRGFDLAPATQPIATKLEVFREYTDGGGKTLDKVTLGDEIQVHLKVRALGDPVSDLALVDLLPGGFEVVIRDPPRHDSGAEEAAPEGDEGAGEADGEDGERGGGDDVGDEDAPHHEVHEDEGRGASFSLPIALEASTFQPEYGDVREDRVVLYGTVEKEVKEFVYAIKATNVGRYAVPPVLGSSMYDRSIVARGQSGKIEVVRR
jgi:uncharacterized protein YfaS (alpha-2-macroglobulin family)